MNKYILIMMLTIFSFMTVSATEKADTIAVNNAKIEKVIVDETTNTKGAKVKKYYILYDGELISTSKTVVEKYNLCKKYNAKIALVIIKKKSNKRIILN